MVTMHLVQLVLKEVGLAHYINQMTIEIQFLYSNLT